LKGGRNDVSSNRALAFQKIIDFVGILIGWNELGNWLSMFRDDNGLSFRLHLIHYRETMSFESAGWHLFHVQTLSRPWFLPKS